MAAKRAISLKRQVVSGLLCLLIPLLLALLFSSFYSVSLYNRKIADSNQRTLTFGVGQIERDLDSVDDFLSSLTANNGDFLWLSGGVGPLQAHLSSYNLITQLKTALPSHPAVGAFFVYSTPSEAYRDTFSMTMTYSQKKKIQATVRQMVADNSIRYSDGWKTQQIDGIPYLFRFYGGRSTYMVAMVPLENALRTDSWQLDSKAYALFAAMDGTPVTGKSLVQGNGVRLEEALQAENGFAISGSPSRYMSMGKPIAHTDLCLFLLVGSTGFLQGLNWVQILLLVLSLLSILVVPLSLHWVRRSLLLPLSDIEKTITAIQSGDLEAQIPDDCPVVEFQQVNDTFNGMISQIRDLKIEAYEKELGRQKAELQYLQLQIRPHFFLNCLKCIYAAAQQRKYDRVQQLILSVSNHIRYIFQDKMDLVPLERELNHIRNYIQIQQLSAANPPLCDIDAPQELLEFPIPPLTLQTFVENSIKHETRHDYQLKLFVKASVLETEEGRYLTISVRDNGTGFSSAVLEEINSDSTEIYTQHHVGLNNIKHRLRLLYGDQVMFAFYNGNPGSVSEILIPYPDQERRDSR